MDSKPKQKPFVKYAELGRDHMQLPCDLCTRTWLNLGYPWLLGTDLRSESLCWDDGADISSTHVNEACRPSFHFKESGKSNETPEKPEASRPVQSSGNWNGGNDVWWCVMGRLGSHGPLSSSKRAMMLVEIQNGSGSLSDSCLMNSACWCVLVSTEVVWCQPSPANNRCQPANSGREREKWTQWFRKFLGPMDHPPRPRCTILDFCRPDLTEVVKSAGHMPSVRSNSSGKHSCGLRYLELFLWLEDASCPHYT